MRFVNRAFALGALLVSMGCASAFDVYHVPKACNACGSSFGSQALFYALPETIITVDATIDKTAVVKAPVCQASDALLKKLGVKLATPSTEMTAALIGSRAEPDPDHVYAVKLSRRWYQKLTSSFSLSETGLLTAADMSVENQAVEFAMTTLKTAAGLAVKLGIGVGGDVEPATECEKFEKEIDDIRGQRRKLIQGKTGTPPPDGAALSLMLAKMDQQEAALLAKFIGATKVTTGVVHCEVTPSKNDADGILNLFRIAPDGIEVDRTRCRVPHDIASVNGGVQVSVRFVTGANAQFAGIAHAASPTLGNPTGLVYRLPAIASIEVLEGGVSKAVDRRQVAQFGYEAALPRSADVAAFQSTVKAALYPGTGAIQKLDFAGTPQGSAVVTGIADAAGTILDARAAAKKAAAAESDVLAQLERQRKILEEKKKIRDLGGTPVDEEDQP